MTIERDGWLSEVLGYDAFRVCVRDGRKEVASDLLHASLVETRLPRAFYYAKVPTQQVEIVHFLETLGFRVVDVNVTLSRRPEESRQAYRGPVTIQDIEPAHYQQVLDIAARCFVYSRFHLDPHIAQATAHAIKRAWVQSYLEKKRGERLLVGLLHGRPVGFLAVLAATPAGEPCRVIDLIGVDPLCQGRGVGRALVSCFVEQYAGVCPSVRVGTQAANVPSLRLYGSLNFQVQETAYVLHAHRGMGGILQ